MRHRRRCADHILRESADCLTVFIHASEEKRAERIVSEYGQRGEGPAKRLADKDNIRKAYYELYTGTKWGSSEHYDICLDSGSIGISECVKVITGLYSGTGTPAGSTV